MTAHSTTKMLTLVITSQLKCEITEIRDNSPFHHMAHQRSHRPILPLEDVQWMVPVLVILF